MPRKLDQEARMTIRQLKKRGWSNGAIASTLRVTEGAVRYHVRRDAQGAADGRGRQRHKAEAYGGAIRAWIEALGDGPLNLVELHGWLTEEHGYQGSLRSVQRYFKARHPKPRRRARRRVETPPGAQGQVDWAEYPDVLVAGRRRRLYAFCLQLSFSRQDALVWSERKDQLSWHHVHNDALRRLEGVPATLRVDNEKTAVVRGAGAWGRINPAYRRYATCVRFHVDACAPRAPQAKGKIERRIRGHRLTADPRRRHWSSLDELQAWTDERVSASARRRVCPATGTTVRQAWERERPHLAPLPILPEPFDLVATRRVSPDCLVAFEGRQYSVPFALSGRSVEVRGCARRVQVVAGGHIVAQHRRLTDERLVIDPAHFEGEATDEVLPPPPLGRMGRRLQEIAAQPPEKRPLDLYAALAEVSR